MRQGYKESGERGRAGGKERERARERAGGRAGGVSLRVCTCTCVCVCTFTDMSASYAGDVCMGHQLVSTARFVLCPRCAGYNVGHALQDCVHVELYLASAICDTM